MKIRIFAAFALLALLLAGCAPAAATRSNAPSAPVAQQPPGEAASPQALDSGKGGFAQEESAQSIDRIVIKNASLRIVVSDPDAAMDSISALADEFGGYVVSANLLQSTTETGLEVPSADITIRVPAERLDEAIDKIKKQSDRAPLVESIDSQDVTSDYVDQQSRLRNLEAAEAQLVKIMDSATKTEDVLSVYNQLVQVRGQIEQTKGQIKYYEQSAALSSLKVNLVANAAVQPLKIGKWEPGGVAKSAVLALLSALKFLGNAAIWLVILVIPVLAIVIIPPYLIIRAILVRRARRRAGPPAPTPAAQA